MKLKEWMSETLIPWLAVGTGFIVVFLLMVASLTLAHVAIAGAFWLVIVLVMAFGPNPEL